MTTEREYGWQFALERLDTRLPHILAEMNSVKQLIGRYWQILCELEDQHCAAVGKLLAQEGNLVRIDDHHFFRWINSEVDKPQSAPSLDDYEVRTFPDGVSVVKVVNAPNEELARMWVTRHLHLRKSFVRNERVRLHRLRSEVILAAKQFADIIGSLEVTGRVPGLCERCHPGRLTEVTCVAEIGLKRQRRSCPLTD